MGRKEGRKEVERRGSDKCTFERDDEGVRSKKVTSGTKSKIGSRGKEGRRVDDREIEVALLRLVKNYEFRFSLCTTEKGTPTAL